VFSVVFLEIWYILIARRLFQLGQDASRIVPHRRLGDVAG
jgi:hypothetical protein